MESLVACNSVTVSDSDTVYDCNVHLNLLRTKITTELNGSEVTIKGNVLRFIEDPLSMVDSKDNVIANADDNYNFINQDDHAIYVNGVLACIVGGDFGFIANHYTIYNTDYKEIAKADFDSFDSYGSITSIDGVVWAEYSSGVLFYDYTVRIHEECELSDEVVLLLMASYKSDKMADN